MRNRKNIFFHTFIGIPVEVVRSSSRALIGVRGRVVDETKNLLVLETESGLKKIQKAACSLKFHLESGEDVIVEGSKICFRPEERPKKMR